MKIYLKVFFILASVSMASAQSITPEVVSSGGGDTINGGVGLSWTIGEPVGETISGSNVKITQGFHQNHFEVISIEEHRELGYDIKVYPNPTTDFIQVSLEYIGKLTIPSNTSFKIVLRNTAGKVLSQKIIKNQLEHTVSMRDYAVGQYFLSITDTEGDLHKSVQVTKLK